MNIIKLIQNLITFLFWFLRVFLDLRLCTSIHPASCWPQASSDTGGQVLPMASELRGQVISLGRLVSGQPARGEDVQVQFLAATLPGRDQGFGGWWCLKNRKMKIYQISALSHSRISRDKRFTGYPIGQISIMYSVFVALCWPQLIKVRA